jgi:hypothetical protein
VAVFDGFIYLTEEKMNEKDIIKALEFCESPTCECTGECPMFNNGTNCISDCRGELHKNALDLINRLKTELLAVKEAWRKSGMDYIDLNAEWEGKYKTAKAEAIKEFEDRLKEKAFYVQESEWDGYVVDCNDIIEFVKEMTEEQK